MVINVLMTISGVVLVARERNGQLTGTGRRIGDLDRSLLLQCRTSQVTQLAGVTGRAGVGLVLTAERGNLRGCLDRARHLLEVDHHRAPLLLDAARYAGDGRLTAAAPFDQRWIQYQRELGLPVLTDSGYLAPDDMEGLVGILERAARLGDAIALLPMHPAWLADRYARQTLLRYVTALGVPIAIVLEEPVEPVEPVELVDPVDPVGAVRGLLQLLDCGVPVLVLRSDLPGLGALGSGATAVAIGTEPGLRRFDPRRPAGSLPTGALPPLRPARPSALIRHCLSYQPLAVIEATMRRHPDNGMWHCGCPTCGGRDLNWLVSREAGRDGVVLQHCVDVLLDLRTELTGPSVQLNQWSWRARCAAAASRRREVGWDRLPMLDHWQQAITPPTSSRTGAASSRRTGGGTRFSRTAPPRSAA
ncbi:hypothetical protein I0C86_01960 [Plantactinospora sp. S1510]|uniref:Uncharacterized protein n=1 Tax=Plantactinospora alkalitolerans TaxID=2789879 RepID=A0ABS0GNK6_9ACTN|nr:hypothetical protein [Plantactinospora alkalitolerans]MBF9127768.1 hypothetical protein [Plantactinospora alkalitolerans]